MSPGNKRSWKEEEEEQRPPREMRSPSTEPPSDVEKELEAAQAKVRRLEEKVQEGIEKRRREELEETMSEESFKKLYREVKELKKEMEWLKTVPHCATCNKFNHRLENCGGPPKQMRGGRGFWRGSRGQGSARGRLG